MMVILVGMRMQIEENKEMLLATVVVQLIFFYLVVVLFRYILRFLFFSRLVDYSLDFFFG